jgi:hypothetical protein
MTPHSRTSIALLCCSNAFMIGFNDAFVTALQPLLRTSIRTILRSGPVFRQSFNISLIQALHLSSAFFHHIFSSSPAFITHHAFDSTVRLLFGLHSSTVRHSVPVRNFATAFWLTFRNFASAFRLCCSRTSCELPVACAIYEHPGETRPGQKLHPWTSALFRFPNETRKLTFRPSRHFMVVNPHLEIFNSAGKGRWREAS